MYRMDRRGFLKLAGVTLLGFVPVVEAYPKGFESEKREKHVIYTFDDIPFEMERTKRLSGILKEGGCRGQFYFTGDAIRVFPDSVDYLISEGFDVGWHSMHHGVMSKKGDKQFLYDVAEWKRTLKDVCPPYSPKLARFPGGRGTGKQIKLLEKEDLHIQPRGAGGISTYNWDIDSRDWSQSQCMPYNAIAANIERVNADSVVVLFHLRLGNLFSCRRSDSRQVRLKESYLLRDLEGFEAFIKKASHASYKSDGYNGLHG